MSLSAAEYEDWRRFYALEPWGELRADLRAGIVASTLANVHRRREARPFKPVDFMPYAEEHAVQREPDPVAYFKNR